MQWSEPRRDEGLEKSGLSSSTATFHLLIRTSKVKGAGDEARRDVPKVLQ